MKDILKSEKIAVLGNSIFLKQQYEIIRIDIDDLIFVKSNLNSVIFQTSQNSFHVISSIKLVEQKLSRKGFYRISRSHIVRINKINSINKSHLKIGNLEIKIGTGYKLPFLNLL